MNKIFIISALFFTACSASKKEDVKNMSLKSAGDAVVLPPCIVHLIDSFKKQDVQNPPRKIYSYTYHDRPVYYIPAICCDMFSDLLDNNCNLLSHPDGGYTGRGDGKTPDFMDERDNEKLIWKDDR